MKIIIFVLATLTRLISSQSVNRVHIMGHIPYMISILQEVIYELERREWCNLKVPDITVSLNETVLGRHYEGTVTYSNGFVASMQRVDVRQSGVDQNWSWNNTDQTGTVHVRGTLRMLDLALGYDVDTDLEDGRHRYTVTVTYPLTLFTFNLFVNVHTNAVRSEVQGQVSTTANINTIRFLPRDHITDVLRTMFNFATPGQGMVGWAESLFSSLALDAFNKVEFPRICYDCTLAASME